LAGRARERSGLAVGGAFLLITGLSMTHTLQESGLGACLASVDIRQTFDYSSAMRSTCRDIPAGVRKKALSLFADLTHAVTNRGGYSMSTFFRVNTLLSAALAAVFYAFFMFAKHDPMLSAVALFLDDPYDAIGSFAAIASILLVLLALVRAFRPYRIPPTEEQKVYLIRTQLAITLAVLITLASDVVAMARHAAMWLGTALTGELLALLAGVAICAVIVTYCIRRSMSNITLPTRPQWNGTIAVSLVAMLILAVYPEGLIQELFGHLFTILAGIMLLFAPLSVLDTALAPFHVETTTAVRTRRRSVFPWTVALLFALSIGLLVFLAETRDRGGHSVPLARIAVVFGVFVGTGTVGVLVGYALLRKPLGLPR
jgi:hypothetical protein